uniref:PyrA7 n=1 Tax=Streptomyces rugosporus TaxID=295838 RepID=K7QQA9_STRRG|nr:PyrA7 [Streptomyces rugosporus]
MNDDKLRDYLKRATADLRQANQRLRDLDAREREPIAVVAMSCRFPGGVTSPDELWRLLIEERDPSSDFPTDRGWELDPDLATRRGAFLDDIAGFDADFFGISPREALSMDPQQRVLLENSWELFERADLDPRTLRGARVGVFVGTNGQDYLNRTMPLPAEVEGYLGTGVSASVMSGRLSYVYGLEGPAVTVDTACSSSLVAVHLAAAALRRGECALALAGGVTIMSTPGIYVEFSRQRGLAADGRVKAFAAAADGTAMSEGSGLLLLERLSDARRNGHPVLAVITGSAVNQDGASNGLTAPNGPAQERVIRDALAQARLRPDDVDAVEAHGTGTTLGDPIEAHALLATYGQHRERPVYVGAIKSNIGHTQAAAGVAGVIKMVLALRHGVLPRSPHIDAPSPHVDWASGDLELLTSSRPWPETGRVRRAGVSSFGLSGTNAHLILEAPDATDEHPGSPAGDGRAVPLVVSAATPEALSEYAGRLRDRPRLDLAATGRTLALGRAHHKHRAAIVAADHDDLARGLAALADGADAAELVRGVPGGRLAFMFSGQGSQRAGAGRELHRAFPAFADAYDAACAALGAPLLDLTQDELDRTANTQPALFAVETALFRLFEHWGVTPDFLIGHSIGEITAAHVSGVLSLEDAAALVSARARLMGALPAGGAMAALRASEEEASGWLEPYAGRVSIAAVNGPASVVISGDEEAVLELAARHRGKRLKVSHAFHSPLMEPMLEEFRQVAAGLTYGPARVPIVSTGGGDPATADYWVGQVREPVRFHQGLQTLRARGVRTFVELGPDAVLTALAEEERAVAALRRDRSEERAVLTALAAVHADGHAVRWEAIFPGAHPHVELPSYAFQRRRSWPTGRAASGLGHPLLDSAVTVASSGASVFTGRFSLETHPWLADHTIGDDVLLPGTAFVDVAAYAGRHVGAGRIVELTLQAPLAVPPSGTVHLQIQVDADLAFTVHSRVDDAWTCHATGVLAEAGNLARDPLDWPEGEPIDIDDLYERVADLGMVYGPAFQCLRAARRDGDDLYAEVELPDGLGERGFVLHPALLDAALHVAILAEDRPAARVPFAWEGVTVRPTRSARLRARLSRGGQGVSLVVAEPDGTVVAEVDSLVTRPLAGREALYEVTWTALPDRPAEGPVPEAVAAGDGLLAVLQSWMDRDEPLVVVTRRAVGVHPGDLRPGVEAAAAWGLVRTAQSENPGRFVLLDVDGGEPVSDELLRAVLASEEPQLALRDGTLHVPRLVRTAPQPALPDGVRLEATAPGTFDGITQVPVDDRPLEPGEIRVAMRAAGLNFRDGLVALGLYPGQPPLGSEGAGVVVEVGEGVTGLAPGDRVMGLFSGCLGSRAITHRQLVAPIPDGWSFVRAAATPLVFLTAYYALTDLAALRPGERVLIHAAAGGVGMAATQLARHLGAEVFGTASQGKWPLLRAAGLDEEHIASSRTLEFADRFAGAGIDVVLNALSGEFLDASLGLLGPGGRFLEMGKTDIRHGEASYRAFDLGEAGPERIQEMLGALVELFEAGALEPLPVTAYDVRQAADALRRLSQGRTTGKVVLTMPAPLDPEGTVLITGGTGALGALTARHLVAAHGVRDLLLISRSGAAPEGLADELAALGARVAVAACDVGDRDALAELLAGVPRLTGVVHAAGVLADATLASLTPAHLERALHAKAAGARNLHDLTLDRDLRLFVMYSSLAGIVGNPGQGAYAAANTVLDALAQRRRALGLPGVSLAWGPWDTETGMTAGPRAAGLGTAQGLALLDAALDDPRALLAPALLDRAAAAEAPAILRTLARPAAARKQLPADLIELVRTEVGAVLGHADAASIDPDREFQALGLDSLTSVELRNRLSSRLGMRLPATLVFDHPTSAALGAHLRELTGGDSVRKGERKRAAAGPVADEPIAIVGMACRYPGGANTPDALWELVAEGRDAITPFPADRGWKLDALYDPDPATSGTTYVTVGGFIDDADRFDAEFFAINPREALATDPQQRLLLETAWQAVEDAGIDPHTLRGSRTGTFVGMAAQHYGVGADTAAVDGYLLTGTTGSVASGRIAYTLGLEGPAITLDTACSSSLVALHLAARALRSGECDLALAGGAAVMSSPGIFVEFSRQRGLAPDGRCKAFADGADGTAWGEGAGLLLVERLSDAVRNGHRVLAVIRGSAINQDGASNGLTAPNGPAQERVIGDALADARLSPSEVDLVEAHGTGTALGDPIEAQSLMATYGRDREQPLYLGSVKSNIGHTQAAAGVAGVIKAVQAIRHGVLPPSLHIDAPSSHVDWSQGAVELLTEGRPWPETGRPRRAAVSSFGISGTNAHVVLEQPPAPEPDVSEPNARPLVWLLGGRNAEAVREQAARLLAHPQDAPAATGRTLAALRGRYEHRAAVVGDELPGLRAGLEAARDGMPHPALHTGVADLRGKTVFVFPGQGAQWQGMARDLLRSEPVFAERLRECAEALAPYTDWSLIDVITEPGHPRWADVDVTQPVLFAVMVSLAELWKAAGVRPDAVIGHSQGEIAAATVAGALTLDDAAKVVALRSKTLRALSGTGTMASIPLSADEVAAASDPARVAIAADNGPSSTVVSGDVPAVRELVERLRAQGIKARLIPNDYASHCAHVESIREELLDCLAGLTPRAAEVPFWSTVTGGELDTTRMDAGYWYRNLRQPVLFAGTVRALLDAGHRFFVECSPHPVLTLGTEQTVEAAGAPAFVTGTLRRDQEERLEFAASLARAHVNGMAVDWAAVLGDGPKAAVPGYPFQRERFWLSPATDLGDLSAAGLSEGGHPLLAAATTVAEDDRHLFVGRLSGEAQPWLLDHAVLGTALVPGSAFAELASYCGARAGCETVEELTIEAPLTLGDGAVHLQVLVGPPDDAGRRPLTVHAKPESDLTWTRHATGTVTPTSPATAGDPTPPAAPDATADLTAWPPPGAEPLDVGGLYERFARSGLGYGPAFQGLRAAWRAGDAVHAEVELPEDVEHAGYGTHPALLDAALHALAWLSPETDDAVRLPFAWTGLTTHAPAPRALRVRITPAPTENGAVRVDLADPSGRPVLTVASLDLRPVDAERLAAGSAVLHGVEWVTVQLPSADGRVRWLEEAPAEDPAAWLDRERPDLVLVRAGGDDPHEATRRALSLLQDERLSRCALGFVTGRAVAAGPADTVSDLAGAAVWGLVKSAWSEDPGRLLLIDADDIGVLGVEGQAPHTVLTDAAIAALHGGEPHIAIREGQIRAPRLARVEAPGGDPVRRLDPEGIVLITGGTGTLGGIVAEHLVTRHDARHLLLLSRTGPGTEQAEAVRARLEELGAEVAIAACDSADRDALAKVVGSLERPLTAVVHAAGVLADATIGSLTAEDLSEVLRPKADAARHLHELTRDHDLAAFVLFSSAAGLLGGAGQGNYAAANTYLDALAAHRRAAGLPATSIAWGIWEAGSGLTARLEAGERRRLSGNGLLPLPTAEALALLDAALAPSAPPVVLAARLGTAALGAQAADGTLHPLLRGLFRSARRPGARASSIADQLAGRSEQEQHDLLVEIVCEQVAAVLGRTGAVDPRRAFQELGFDSLTGVDLRNRLNARTGLRLPATLVFDYPNADALAGYLLTRAAPPRQNPVDAALADVERLAAALSALPDEERAVVARRLRALTASPEPAGTAVADRLKTSSADEIFDFIDRELRQS